jgi:plastocyanin
MRGLLVPLCAVVLAAATLESQPSTGTIKGHVHLIGKRPGNAVIRMGMDPKCSEMNKGKQILQETVRAASDGSLSDVFVRLEGVFPATPVPKAPVTIDQHACVYSPRVVGVRVGQVLEIRNSDNLLHNVHSVTNHDNAFNFGQARAGVVDSFRTKSEETMLRLGCDLHRWMTAYAGVVNHPYFAVTDAAGLFEIKNVPPGTYTIDAWQERFGMVKKSDKVTAGGTVNVDVAYTQP